MIQAFWRLVYVVAERVMQYAERRLPQEPDVLSRLRSVQQSWLERGPFL